MSKIKVAIEMMVAEKIEEYLHHFNAPMRGLKWTREEEKELIAGFNMMIEFLARVHRRTPGGIKARLDKLYGLGQLC